MKRFDVEKIRNVALVGHGGSGKTSLGEAMIFVAGAANRLGKVDDGNSILDFEPEEKSHNLTLSTGIASFEYDKNKITILDTPGYDVFLYDGMCALHAAEAAILVAGGDGDIKFEAEKMWKRAEELGLPRAVTITKLDKENTSFDKVMELLPNHFDSTFVKLHLPIGSAGEFMGFVDLLTMKAVTFSDASGKGEEGDIPADLADLAQSAREEMVEGLVETDESLMEKFFEGEDISTQELEKALATGMASGDVVPVTVACGTSAVGAKALLDLIVSAFPSPADRAEVAAEGIDGITADESKPLAAVVFKTISDPFAGRLNIFRVYQGKMTPDASYHNATKDAEERIGQIAALFGKELVTLPEAGPGDIFAVPKLKETVTGDTFTKKGASGAIEFSAPPVPLISYAATAKKKGEEDKLGQGIRKMQDEDITLRVNRNAETKELVVSCMGRLHIDIINERMKRKYGAEMELKTPKVPYRETLKGSTKVQGRHKKQSGGRGQFADTWIEIKPLKSGEGFQFVDKIVGGAIPRQYIPAVEAGIKERMAKGVIAGYPVVDVEVTLYDGKYHDVDSSEMAFKIAGSLGFKKGAMECKPVLLEPIHMVTVRVPDASLGDVIGDLNSRRGRVLGMDPEGGWQVVKAHVPLSEVQAYAPDLRSMTAGRGTFVTEFDHYEEVPAQLAEKIIAEANLDEDEE
ncbi:MAG: elongation factor G [Deltaproteobacteria bacterium]|nr:MAG: elongation factor G [Deltaproteobacteria bacterium]